VEPIIQVPGQDISEIAGPCFSPDGQRLYFSSQRGPVGSAGLPLGITYEVTGPFDELLGRT
jgi:secreted PhoX family phosphatase